MSDERTVHIPLPSPRLALMALVCMLVGGYCFFLAAGISIDGVDREHVRDAIMDCAFFASIGAVSLAALALLIFTRRTASARFDETLHDPASFLWFAYLCTFMANVGAGMFVEHWPDTQGAIISLFQTSDGAWCVCLMAALELFVTGWCLYLIYREWRLPEQKRDYFRVVLSVWGVRFLGCFVAYMALGILLLGIDEGDLFGDSLFSISELAAAITWTAILLLAMAAMKERIAAVRALRHYASLPATPAS